VLSQRWVLGTKPKTEKLLEDLVVASSLKTAAMFINWEGTAGRDSVAEGAEYD